MVHGLRLYRVLATRCIFNSPLPFGLSTCILFGKSKQYNQQHTSKLEKKKQLKKNNFEW